MADRFLETGQPLNILVYSAGIMACPLLRDARGYESQFRLAAIVVVAGGLCACNPVPETHFTDAPVPEGFDAGARNDCFSLCPSGEHLTDGNLVPAPDGGLVCRCHGVEPL